MSRLTIGDGIRFGLGLLIIYTLVAAMMTGIVAGINYRMLHTSLQQEIAK